MDITWLANYPLLTVAANLTGVVGFGLAIFFYLRQKRNLLQRPDYRNLLISAFDKTSV